MNESNLNWENWKQQKEEARQKLLELPPAEAQARVESILYPQYWHFDLNQSPWQESFYPDEDEIDP
jgi:hypothetical protein